MGRREVVIAAWANLWFVSTLCIGAAAYGYVQGLVVASICWAICAGVAYEQSCRYGDHLRLQRDAQRLAHRDAS